MSIRLLVRMSGVHVNCRNGLYPFSQIQRFPVPDNKVPWREAYEDYNPPDYTAPQVLNKDWADPDINDPAFKPAFNMMDAVNDPPTDRRSRMGIYTIKDKRPVNPEGRTGVRGRGTLGKWGPNQAADPVVTKWKREKNYIVVHQQTAKPILQFCAVKRKDTGEWAIPGGMIYKGEVANETLKRGFAKQALNIVEKDILKNQKLLHLINEIFAHGEEIHRGYMDDFRNTDNAWIESVVMNYHDDIGSLVNQFTLKPNDQRVSKVKWMDIDRNVGLFSVHEQMIKDIAIQHHAHY